MFKADQEVPPTGKLKEAGSSAPAVFKNTKEDIPPAKAAAGGHRLAFGVLKTTKKLAHWAGVTPIRPREWSYRGQKKRTWRPQSAV